MDGFATTLFPEYLRSSFDCEWWFQVFFMKSQIFSGQVASDSEHIQDFAWATKEELSKYLNASYYDGIKDCLADN